MPVTNNRGLARRAVLVVPSDTVDLPPGSTGLFVGGQGGLRIVLADDPDGNAFTLTQVTKDSLQAMQVRRVFASGTTATNIIALYS